LKQDPPQAKDDVALILIDEADTAKEIEADQACKKDDPSTGYMASSLSTVEFPG
jgi:hypothetical protein